MKYIKKSREELSRIIKEFKDKHNLHFRIENNKNKKYNRYE